jgi:hypothetical protein
MKVKVRNITSPRGNKVANQFIIMTTENVLTYGGHYAESEVVYFQSYKSIIVRQCNGKTELDDTFWDYSKTTGKYRNIFLGETKAETQKKIDSGEYIMTDLN